jgi:hypothetical protein
LEEGDHISKCYWFRRKSQKSVVGIVTGYGLDGRGSELESRYGHEFSLLHVVLTGSGALPASYPMGIGGSFPRGKAAVADDAPPASAVVKKTCVYISTPPYAFLVQYLISYARGQLYRLLRKTDDRKGDLAITGPGLSCMKQES